MVRTCCHTRAPVKDLFNEFHLLSLILYLSRNIMMSSKRLRCLMRIHLQEEFFSGPSRDRSRRAESIIEVYPLFSKLLNYYCLARSHFKFCRRNSFLVHRSLIIRVKGVTLHIQTLPRPISQQPVQPNLIMACCYPPSRQYTRNFNA